MHREQLDGSTLGHVRVALCVAFLVLHVYVSSEVAQSARAVGLQRRHNAEELLDVQDALPPVDPKGVRRIGA